MNFQDIVIAPYKPRSGYRNHIYDIFSKKLLKTEEMTTEGFKGIVIFFFATESLKLLNNGYS